MACNNLISRTDFATYVLKINQTTAFKTPGLNRCKVEICTALWGSGNADISGIGMVVGYNLELVLGTVLTLTLLIWSPPFIKRSAKSKLPRLLDGVTQSYFSCAAFFTASIQISCIVVLARRDFAITAVGMGGFTVQITWSISLVCMLSILAPLTVLHFVDPKRSSYRLFLFSICWLCYFYTFISRMIGDFAPTQIGKGAGENGKTIISSEDWVKLENLCLARARKLSVREQKIFSDFGAAGSILIATTGLALLLWYICKQHSEEKQASLKKRLHLEDMNAATQRKVSLLVVMIVLLLAVPQVWAIFRLRSIQALVVRGSGNQFTDDQWTFGQIVAVMLFLPVFTEMGYLWITLK